jgi:hypothetical protein
MENTFDLKKFLVENKLTNNSKLLKEAAAKEELQKQLFDFINSNKVQAILTKAVEKLTPEEKEGLAGKLQTLSEGSFDSFEKFKQFTEKGLQTSLEENKINEALSPEEEALFQKNWAEFLQKYGGTINSMDRAANKVYNATKLTAGTLAFAVGGVLKGLGVANIMSMGFLPGITAAALDHFAGTDILMSAAELIGVSGSGAAALSVVAGLLGGAIAWGLGDLLLGGGSQALFE